MFFIRKYAHLRPRVRYSPSGHPRPRHRSLPVFRSLDELVAFFDTHDLGHYWDEMPEAEDFEVYAARFGQAGLDFAFRVEGVGVVLALNA